ncbi:hypothetical protein EUTSA_v10027170mg, partial [Eutrema salsugineum]
EKVKNPHWRSNYDYGLCARLGLYCYNFQNGTDYDFLFVRKIYRQCCYSFNNSFFITVEALNPSSDRPRLTFETCVKHNDGYAARGEGLWWETCIFRLKGSQEADDDEWDNVAINDYYKGEMPQWLSDEDRQRCYVVEGSELHHRDNWWLPLFTELAFYTIWIGELTVTEIGDYAPLRPQEVVVETRGEEEAETEPRDKLKVANAIFYISFQCADDLENGGLGDYRAVVRKTMDGKPGHMRLEVICWSEDADEESEESGSESSDFEDMIYFNGMMELTDQLC